MLIGSCCIAVMEMPPLSSPPYLPPVLKSSGKSSLLKAVEFFERETEEGAGFYN